MRKNGNKQDDLNFNLSINNLHGRYKVSNYSQNRDQGSAFDEWAELGYPEDMSREQVAYLKAKDSPKLTTDYIKVDGSFKKEFKVPLHGIEMIILEKVLLIYYMLQYDFFLQLVNNLSK